MATVGVPEIRLSQPCPSVEQVVERLFRTPNRQPMATYQDGGDFFWNAESYELFTIPQLAFME
jgi:hypothetical protein